MNLLSECGRFEQEDLEGDINCGPGGVRAGNAGRSGTAGPPSDPGSAGNPAMVGPQQRITVMRRML